MAGRLPACVVDCGTGLVHLVLAGEEDRKLQLRMENEANSFVEQMFENAEKAKMLKFQTAEVESSTPPHRS